MAAASGDDLRAAIWKGLGEGKIVQVPVDPRYTCTTDQSQHCWVAYNEFLRCAKSKGFNADVCKTIRNHATSTCPSFWRNEFKEQREGHKFTGFEYEVQEEEEVEEDDDDDDEEDEE
mmetsp:Transcript_16112/g.22673  ORF Transcript_16112/g.22673 Transcript_16112/m.22673 type:complete len:117 (-) Transcript_16112:196-546(-)|eukprot:CAMPEP_0175151510 /NCGR_PEP_ID=MMETSP0087-20121206/18555_1 /TAXON_ID=136419 /ORGANISM="Unknown Unknown, Strain D1" /LENGTH=116 /DNA_ID=CAMNT_0016437753 /DNA_START=26 /DNA_END=376 /DNA_ORIENTATION=-